MGNPKLQIADFRLQIEFQIGVQIEFQIGSQSTTNLKSAI